VLLFAARCLDQYFELRVKEVEQKEQVEIDPRLVDVVERMLDRWAPLRSTQQRTLAMLQQQCAGLRNQRGAQ
jgi:hypothetical protein